MLPATASQNNQRSGEDQLEGRTRTPHLHRVPYPCEIAGKNERIDEDDTDRAEIVMARHGTTPGSGESPSERESGTSEEAPDDVVHGMEYRSF